MCTIWTQAEWKQVTNAGSNVYSLVGEFTNEAGETALQVKEVQEDEEYYWNVYSKNGRDSSFHMTKEGADTSLQKRGFTAKTQTEKQEAAPASAYDVELVLGRTLKQWNEQGNLNEGLPSFLHVHPQRPAGREPTEKEKQAYVNSLTTTELLEGLLEGIGLPSAS